MFPDLTLATRALNRKHFCHQPQFKPAMEACTDLPTVSLKLPCVDLPGVAVIHYALEMLPWQQRSMLPHTENKTLTIPLVANETIHHLLFKRLKTKPCTSTENKEKGRLVDKV